MKITLNEEKPIEHYSYKEVGQLQLDNGKPQILHKSLPIYIGEYQNENSELDFIIICSDLQGVVEKNGEFKLLGEELPEFLKLLIDIELSKDDNPKIGVILCGDLYSNLDKRGSSGDVRNVWLSFKKQFNLIIGVAGNHDRFGNPLEIEEFKSIEGIHLLHKEKIEVAKLKIGGISGIIGRGDKVNRVDEKEYLNSLTKLINQGLDLILLHESPDYPSENFIGNARIRDTINKGSNLNICCGHCFWEKALVNFENNSKVINVDSKVVILKKK